MVQSILIVKIGAIGDVVMSLPMLSFFREKYPTANITWVCGKTVAPLIEATALVDELISIDENRLYQGWALIKLWRVLLFRSFDLVITAHADPRYRLISLFCRKRVHRTFNRTERYHVHEYVRLACPDEGTIAPPFPKIHLPKRRFETTAPLVLIAPGGAKNSLSEHPLRRFARLPERF